jgi:predicted amidohydrolase YtcJ
MHEEYADGATAGHLYLDADQVREHVVHCTRKGLQAGFHVIGDRAAREVVAGFRKAAEEVGPDAIVAARHRLEHVEMPDAEAIATLAELGIVASVQPVFDAYWGAPGELYDQRLGWERARRMNPFGSLHRSGVVLAFGSDSPVTPLDPWRAVQAAAHHHDPEERLTVRAAFNAHTRGGHRARHDDVAGVLAPGAAATFAVWDVPGDLIVQTPDARVAAWSTDPRAGVPVLPDLQLDVELPICVRTVVRGTTVYTAEDV